MKIHPLLLLEVQINVIVVKDRDRQPLSRSYYFVGTLVLRDMYLTLRTRLRTRRKTTQFYSR